MSTWAGQSVALIGDSQMEGLNRHLKALLEARGARVPASAIHWDRGAPITRLTPVVRGKLRSAGSTMAIVAAGGNDRPASQEAYYQSLQALLGELRAGGAREIVWAGPAAVRPEVSAAARDADVRHDRIAELQESLLPQMGVTWVDSRGLTRTGHRSDGVHFTATGYRSWADALVDALIDADPVKKEQERRRRSVVGIAIGLSITAVVAGIFVATINLRR